LNKYSLLRLLTTPFGTRIVFLLLIFASYSQLHFTDFKTSETDTEFSCGIVSYSDECSIEVDQQAKDLQRAFLEPNYIYITPEFFLDSQEYLFEE